MAGKLRGPEIADVLARALDEIIGAAHKDTGPFLYYIYKDGSIRRIQ